MKALVGAFNQEEALVGAFSVIVQPVVEPMDRFTALVWRMVDGGNIRFLHPSALGSPAACCSPVCQTQYNKTSYPQQQPYLTLVL